MRGRLIVCDPGCVQPAGHNVASLRYFADAFRTDFAAVQRACCRYLPAAIAEANQFLPVFDFYYLNYLVLASDTTLMPTHPPVGEPHYDDPIEAVATADAAELLDGQGFDANDSVMFPSADFYGVLGMLNAIWARPAPRRPRLLLRLIGVMEFASPVYRAPLAQLIVRLREAFAAGLDIAVSAETPAYADHLAEKLGRSVTVTPYPMFGQPLAMAFAPSFRIFCPGWARADKGYFELLDIFQAVRRRDEALSIRFISHVPHDRDAEACEAYTSQLAAIPGVELRSPTTSDTDMLRDYRNCHAVLLPYDPAIYALRGSAVMMEAASHGRPILTQEGLGFAAQVSYYGLGRVAGSRDELVDNILALATEPLWKLEAAARQARHRFEMDGAAALRGWVGLRP